MPTNVTPDKPCCSSDTSQSDTSPSDETSEETPVPTNSTPGKPCCSSDTSQSNKPCGTTEDMQVDIPAKSVDSLLIDPFEAKLPPYWKWIVTSGDDQDHVTKTAVKFILEHEESVLKSVSFVGNKVFYKVKGINVKRPFLPDTFNSTSDISQLLSTFDDAPICVECDLKLEELLIASNDTARSSTGWRAKYCSRVLQKGSVCFRCDQVNKSCSARMDMLAARKKRDANKLRTLEQKLKRTQQLVEVLFVF